MRASESGVRVSLERNQVKTPVLVVWGEVREEALEGEEGGGVVSGLDMMMLE